jgi:hypothetical protein
MSERPILFSAPMIRAILAGTKTQTRRALRDQPCKLPDFNGGGLSIRVRASVYQAFSPKFPPVRCPYGQPGDRLWVREAFAIVPRTAYRCSEGVQQILRPDDDHDAAIYREGWVRSNGGFRWRPSIHMPRWASRITLEITEVRVERLQEISEADADAEGARDWAAGQGTPVRDLMEARLQFRALWQSINGPESWDANPYVWVVSFRRVEQEARKP